MHFRSPPWKMKTWMKIDPQYQRQRCSAETVVSGNIRFMHIFTGRWGIKRQWGNRKHRFSGLSDTTSSAPYEMRPTFQHYYGYIVLFSPLSPFHWCQNTWLEWSFYIKFSLLHTALHFQNLFSILTVEPIYRIFLLSRHQQRCAEADCDPQNIWDPWKDCRYFVDEKLPALYCLNFNK